MVVECKTDGRERTGDREAGYHNCVGVAMKI